MHALLLDDVKRYVLGAILAAGLAAFLALLLPGAQAGEVSPMKMRVTCVECSPWALVS